MHANEVPVKQLIGIAYTVEPLFEILNSETRIGDGVIEIFH
jgi:hypothetical protein